MNVKKFQAFDLIELDYEKLIKNEISEISKLKKSIYEQGFLFISNHNLSSVLYNSCLNSLREFFKKPKVYKNQFLAENIDQKAFGNIGYFPFRSEIAIGSKYPDIKEFYHIGPIAIKDKTIYPENNWPQFDKSFKANFELIYKAYHIIGYNILNKIFEHKKVPNHISDNVIGNHNGILRLINYPSIANTKGNRAHEHTGINLIGIQVCPTKPGLEIFHKDGYWGEIPQNVWKDRLVINLGEMLPVFLRDKRIIPTLHRVENPTVEDEISSRQALVYFYHANPLSNISENLSAGQWFKNRLAEIKTTDNNM